MLIESMYRHVQLMLQLMDKGAITFDYGNNIRARAQEYEAKHTKNIKFHRSETSAALISPVCSRLHSSAFL